MGVAPFHHSTTANSLPGKMTTFYITPSSNPSRYTEFRSYIPNSKPKPKSKPRLKSKIKIGPNLSEPDSREGGFWHDIEDFPMPDSYTSLRLDLESSDPFKDAHPGSRFPHCGLMKAC